MEDSGGNAILQDLTPYFDPVFLFHMGSFHMNKTATILFAMILLVAVVDLASYSTRRVLTR